MAASSSSISIPFRKHCLLNGLDDIGLTLEKHCRPVGHRERLRPDPWRVLPAARLANLICANRKKKLFTRQLIAGLKLVESGDVKV
jgi:hypothetical protein